MNASETCPACDNEVRFRAGPTRGEEQCPSCGYIRDRPM